MDTADSFALAVREHDRAVSRSGLNLWVGSEPTFTDRHAQSPEWLSSALGGEKEERARSLAGALAEHLPGVMILRSTGRIYPGEAEPRWSIGLYRRCDGERFWQGPPDPLLASGDTVEIAGDPESWASALVAAFSDKGWRADISRDVDVDADAFRVVVYGQEETSEGMIFVLSFAAADTQGKLSAQIELPAIDGTLLCQEVLRAVEQSAISAGLPTLIIAGEAPPTDDQFELTTITPDPAVIEINSAPNASAEQFLWRSRRVYDSAATVGLTPYRLYFNGAVGDSGGGGHITLGGPSPLTSPFVQQPCLVLRLVRFFNHHPALSYLFAHDFVGSSGISVRPDERGTDAFDELILELDLLENFPQLTPELVWQGLSPFLCDVAGNGHRAEINIEKLWNPFLRGRGRLGLIEFRALRMPQSPERATALACLLRGIVAMLSAAPYCQALIDWGRTLHERFALPFYLEQDLQQVFNALTAAGFGLGREIERDLRIDEFRIMAKVRLPGCVLDIRRALEFWPLLGDATSDEQGGSSRLIDSSTTRIELRLLPESMNADTEQEVSPSREWSEIAMFYGNSPLPMRSERDDVGELKVYSLRYRRFPPTQGLHPILGAQSPVTLRVCYLGQSGDYVISLHEWEPHGEAYPGLPEDMAEAELRRSQRVTVSKAREDISANSVGSQPRVALRGIGEYCIDLRYAISPVSLTQTS